MNIQAQISIYALRTRSLSEAIEQFVRVLEDKGLEVRRGSMSSSVRGESQRVFDAVRQGFEKVAQTYDVVIDLKVSNACPPAVPATPSPQEKK
jgi:uncharacterized protein YqgV (UPF0045/DUF77 family)